MIKKEDTKLAKNIFLANPCNPRLQQIVILADNRDEAVNKALQHFGSNCWFSLITLEPTTKDSQVFQLHEI